MTSTTASRTVEELCRLFSSFGLPEQIVTDNSPQFVSEEFGAFTKMNGIKHIKNAPYNPSTNGAVERLVQTFKKAMKAGVHDGRTHSQRLASFLLSYQSTPHTTTHGTPGELFLKRKLRTRFDLIKPDVTKSVCAEQAKQKSNHDHHSQGREYFVGQNVQAHNFSEGPRWALGVIVERLGLLTYLVQIDTGVFWQCHIEHLCPVHDRSPDTNKTIPSTSVIRIINHFQFHSNC